MFKRLFSILLAILLFGGMAFAATPGYRQSPGTGNIIQHGGYISDPHKTFRLVRWVGERHWNRVGQKLSADSIVIWDTISDDGVTITTVATSYDSRVAGVIVVACLSAESWDSNSAAIDRSKRNWTWMQTYGKSQVDLATTAIVLTVGSALATGDVVGRAGVFWPTNTTSAQLQGNAGFFYDAESYGATNCEVFLRVE